MVSSIRRYCSNESAEFYPSKITCERSRVRAREGGGSEPIYLEFPKGATLPLRNTVEMDPHSEVKQNSAYDRKTQHAFTCAQ